MTMRLACIVLWLALPACVFAQQKVPDPTRPPTSAEIEAWLGNGAGSERDAPFRLQSILLAPGRRVAIIDGKRLRPGETLDNATVTTIEPGRVVLERGDETIELNIETHLTKDKDGLGN